MKQQASSASTSGPNTSETDRQRFVKHNVTCKYDGKIEIIQIYATDPADAIKKVNNMDVDEYLCFDRV